MAALTRRAVEHGVRRLVLLSGRGEPAAQEAEALFAAAAEPAEWTVLRASWFSQDFSETFMADATRAGELALPVGDVPEPFVDAEDIADVAVAALTEDGHAGRTYELTGPRAITFDEAVRTIGAAARRDIRLVRISHDALQDGLTTEGVPAETAELIGVLFREVLDGRNAAPRRRGAAGPRPPAARLRGVRAHRRRGRRVAAVAGGGVSPRGRGPPRRAPVTSRAAQYHFPAGESAEGERPTSTMMIPSQSGPEDRHQDADDHDDPAEADPAETCVTRGHSRSSVESGQRDLPRLRPRLTPSCPPRGNSQASAGNSPSARMSWSSSRMERANASPP